VGLAALAGMVLLVSVRRKAPAVLLGGLAALAGLAVLTVALPEELQHRYLTLVDSSQGPRNAEESVKGRIDGIVLGFELFQRSPLLGNGPSSFVHATGKGLQPHNLYGQVLSETGAVGALALLALVVCFAWNWAETRRLYRTHPALRPRNVPGEEQVPADLPYLVSRSVFLTIMLMLLMGCAGHNLYRYNWQWFAAFGAISLHCVRARVASFDSARAFAPAYGIGPRPRLRPSVGR
jgi:O-antigen ligase